MNNQELESIWVDGIPNKINKEDLLTVDEMIKICIRFTVERILIPRDYKIIGIVDQPNNFPNITAEKNGIKYAIVVLPEVFPRFSSIVDDFRFKFVAATKERELLPVLCPVLIKSYDKQRADKGLLLKGDLYNLSEIGQIILTDEEKQLITPQTLNFKF